jgi:hypothetical protein
MNQHYLNRYLKFIDALKNQSIDGYSEKHHIMPRSMGGGSVSMNFLHSPATTSAVSYKTQFASSQNNGTVYVQISSAVSTITLMEIAG